MEKICNGLTKIDFDYHLSGDCLEFCHCILTNERCIGIWVDDPEDRSSQFFSRGKNVVSEKGLKKCPTYGASVETFKQILKEKTDRELEEKLSHLK